MNHRVAVVATSAILAVQETPCPLKLVIKFQSSRKRRGLFIVRRCAQLDQCPAKSLITKPCERSPASYGFRATTLLRLRVLLPRSFDERARARHAAAPLHVRPGRLPDRWPDGWQPRLWAVGRSARGAKRGLLDGTCVTMKSTFDASVHGDATSSRQLRITWPWWPKERTCSHMGGVAHGSCAELLLVSSAAGRGPLCAVTR